MCDFQIWRVQKFTPKFVVRVDRLGIFFLSRNLEVFLNKKKAAASFYFIQVHGFFKKVNSSCIYFQFNTYKNMTKPLDFNLDKNKDFL